MRAASIVITIGSALLFAATSAHALGFGRVSNTTRLGQPLNFAATIRLDAEETLARECVSAEVFSGDNKLQPGQIRVTLEGNADSSERSVRITSTALIDEPVLTVSVTVGCSAKVKRRFVAFIDPPLINLAQAEPTGDASALGPQRVDSQVAPLLTIVQASQDMSATPRRAAPAAPAGPAGTRAKARPVIGARDVARDSAPPSRKLAAGKDVARRKNAPPARAVVVARPAPAGPRLQLEATPTVVARAASAGIDARAVAAPALVASAPLADEQTLAIERERQRIVVLEGGLASLRSDSQATQKSLSALQTQLKAAEAERYANPLVYALAWLSGLLTLAVAALWWRQARIRTASQWWAAPEPAAASAEEDADMASAEPPMSGAQSLSDPLTVANTFEVAHGTGTQRSPPVPLVVRRAAAVLPSSPAPVEPVYELSVEELIDLEQQAEFFVVLGQDEAAIDLLMNHVRSDGGISPLPYLKLLEIYRRRGESDAYERIRERFNRRFNAYAPEWDSDLQQGRSLEDYPDIIDRLNALWVTPARAMETLDASLFRRNKSDQTFDLPAYRELLFLYSIARDLAEHGGSDPQGDVDLLLPLAEDEPIVRPVSRLLATPAKPAGFVNSDMMTLPLDLDVSFGPSQDPYDDSLETTPSALRRTPEQRFGTDSGFLDFDPTEAKVGTRPAKTDKAGSSSGR
jgi:hypothetical protein